MGEQRKKTRMERAQAGEIVPGRPLSPEALAGLHAIDWDEQDRLAEEHRLAGYPSLDRDDELAGYPDRNNDNN